MKVIITDFVTDNIKDNSDTYLMTMYDTELFDEFKKATEGLVEIAEDFGGLSGDLKLEGNDEIYSGICVSLKIKQGKVSEFCDKFKSFLKSHNCVTSKF